MATAAVAEAEAEGGRWRAFLSGRLERGSAEVGIASGMGSDILRGESGKYGVSCAYQFVRETFSKRMQEAERWLPYRMLV